MDVRRVLEYALQREHEGLAFFSIHADKASHAAVTGIFRRLVVEEQSHIEYIERLIAGLSDEGTPVEVPLVDEDRSFFDDRAASEMIEQTTVEAMVPDLPVLRMAFLIERDLAEFYTEQAARIEGPARSALERLAAWEREHEQLFKSLHDRIFTEYAGMPWGG